MKGKTQNIVFFADSYCSWQKGAVENANKLIRRYIKKKANFNDYTDKFIMAIQHNINKRPRKKLKFNTTHRSIVSSIFLGNVAIAVGLYSISYWNLYSKKTFIYFAIFTKSHIFALD